MPRTLVAPVLLALLATTAGCATVRGPVAVDCATLGMASITDANRRVELTPPGFAVELPRADHWCVNPRAGVAGVVLGKNPFGGRLLDRAPALAERAHTFGALALAVEIQGARIDSADALRRFFEQWQRHGEPGRIEHGRMVLLASSGPASTTMTPVSSTLEDTTIGAIECVRLDKTDEERNNRLHPGQVLVLVTRAWYCRHPRSSGLVMIGYSERYLQGHTPDPPLMLSLAPEIEPFVQSLRVTAP